MNGQKSPEPVYPTHWWYVKDVLHRRWRCFRKGHIWHSALPGANWCDRCGKLVEW